MSGFQIDIIHTNAVTGDHLQFVGSFQGRVVDAIQSGNIAIDAAQQLRHLPRGERLAGWVVDYLPHLILKFGNQARIGLPKRSGSDKHPA